MQIAHLNKCVVQVDVNGNGFQSPSYVSDIVDVAIHIHVTPPCYLHSSLILQLRTFLIL